jgi:hypothetical protein
MLVGGVKKVVSLKAATIDKGADRKQNELLGWKASAKNLEHLEP